MPKQLVIVESPTKARTLKKFLGADYIVNSSVGHIRDLPASAAEIPAAYKKEPWARLGVNVENDFAPLYVMHGDKKKRVAELKKQLADVDVLLLATDEDREGEAISWHLVDVLRPKIPTRRMVFHEITREAILQSLQETREIDRHLVDAQETRRIIDRLYGYEVSPILWRKIAPRLSAGRVQSIAIRMLVEREMARMRFRSASFWDLAGEFADTEGRGFAARMVSLGGERLAGSRDFDPDTGKLTRAGAVLLDEPTARTLVTKLQGAPFRVLSTEEKPFTQSPQAPFTTSTLQQEGNNRLRFDARRTMRAAQRLYESGFITYMRTDSVALSKEAIDASRRSIRALYGPEYVPPTPRQYQSRVKNAQEAHEAIRPAGDQWATPESLVAGLGPDEARVYELIWKRTLASQMPDARGRRLSAKIGADAGGREAVFAASGTVIEFPGFRQIYAEVQEETEGDPAERQGNLPPLRRGDAVRARKINAEGHVTQPPPRLTEATLIRSLEESGIGRPSTYASIIETIQRREYTFKKGSALVPTFTAFAVVNLMVEHLPNLVDLEFTARMEDRLDAIARGEMERLPYLREFYNGNGTPGLKATLSHKAETIDPRAACTIPLERRDAEGPDIVVRVGRFGPYLQRADGSEGTAPIPDGTCPDELTWENAMVLLADGARGPQILGTHPDSGKPIYLKKGRFGPYVQLGDGETVGKKTLKPRMVSLLAGMDPESFSLDEALLLLSLPRLLGSDAGGMEIHAHNGRFGAYIKRGEDSRSLEAGDHILTVTLERALELLAKEKRGRGPRAAAEAVKEFPTVAALEGRTVKLLLGRYGPYVTDGKTNASLPKDFSDPTSLTEGQAAELILARQEQGSARPRPVRRRTTTTTTKKKTKKTPVA
jgi:DNA topoisomerase-1